MCSLLIANVPSFVPVPVNQGKWSSTIISCIPQSLLYSRQYYATMKVYLNEPGNGSVQYVIVWTM